MSPVPGALGLHPWSCWKSFRSKHIPERKCLKTRMWIIQFWPIAIKFFNKSRAGVAIYFFRFCSNCMLRLKVCHFSKWEVYDSTIFGWVRHLQLCATGWLGSFWCVDMHIWYIDSWWILKEWPSGLTFFYIFMFLSCCGGFVHSSFISSEWKTLQSSRQRLSLSLILSLTQTICSQITDFSAWVPGNRRDFAQ